MKGVYIYVRKTDNLEAMNSKKNLKICMSIIQVPWTPNQKLEYIIRIFTRQKTPIIISQPSAVVIFSAGIYLLKVNHRNIKTRCEICSKLTIKTPEQRQYFGISKWSPRKIVGSQSVKMRKFTVTCKIFICQTKKYH